MKTLGLSHDADTDNFKWSPLKIVINEYIQKGIYSVAFQCPFRLSRSLEGKSQELVDFRDVSMMA